MRKEPKPSYLGMLILPLIIGAVGVEMVAAPHLAEGEEPHGRNRLHKQLEMWLWGTPCGIVLLILSLLMAVIVFLPDKPSDGDKEEKTEKINIGPPTEHQPRSLKGFC